MSEWIDFKELRSKLVFDDVLRHYNLKLNVKGEKANGFCPLPTHQGQKRSPSFSADLIRGIWQCFGCHAKGNLLDLCVRLEGLNPADPKELRQGALKVRALFFSPGALSKGDSANPAREPPSQPVLVNAAMDFELQGLDPEHPYLRHRGFTDKTIQHFGLGFCNRGMLKGRVAIPLHDIAGKLVGYAGRLTRDDQVSEANPKYKFPGARERKGTTLEFRKSLLLYNANRIAGPVDHLFVVEGFPATWWLWQHEYRNVVALMGSDCSDVQGEAIVKLVKPDGIIWAMPDGNNAGDHCAHTIFETVAPERCVRWVSLSNNEQPTDFVGDELTALLV
jgi:DNA primase